MIPASAFLTRLEPSFLWLLRTSWQAAILALLVLFSQWVLGRRISARWRYNLWLLVLLRLVIPAVPASRLSIHNLFSRAMERPSQTASLSTSTDLTTTVAFQQESL